MGRRQARNRPSASLITPQTTSIIVREIWETNIHRSIPLVRHEASPQKNRRNLSGGLLNDFE
jgi:hypothetical protein